MRAAALRFPSHSLRSGLSNLAFGALLVGIIARLLIAADVLALVGIKYASPGGNPLIKIHIGTYLMCLAVVIWLIQSGSPMLLLAQHLRGYPSQCWFLAMMAVCLVHMTLSVAPDGSLMVIVDTFICAGLTTMLLVHASPEQLRIMTILLLGIIVFNGVIAVIEATTHQTVIPEMSLEADMTKMEADEWRGRALYDSALAGSMLTQMAIFLILARQSYWTLPLLVPLIIGLVAFGGRTALAVTACTLALLLIGFIVRDVASRRISRQLIGWTLIACLAVPVIGWLSYATPIGERIVTHLYMDESAKSRDLAWNVLWLLDEKNLLVGSSIETVQIYVTWLQITEIENPWLDLLLSLGIVGSTFFLLGFMPFLLHLWRMSGLFGRLILVTVMIVASTSNSIGRKSNLLVIMVAFVIASNPAKLIRRRNQSTPRPMITARYRATS